MESQIRKISIGRDYKDAMHYSVGQEVYGGHTIKDIIQSNDNSVTIFIVKDEELKPWKKFNTFVGIALEYNLEY